MSSGTHDTPAAPLSKAHVPALDGVRGIAILVVLVHNLSIIEARETIAQKLWTAAVEAGWIGVQLFFALSGYLITGILLDEKDSPDRTRVFYIRRVLRIFPLYYAFLVVYFVVAARIAPSLQRPFSETVWYWLYLSNWSTLAFGLLPGLGHVWSLAVEEQFYVVWPWIAGRTRAATFAAVCIGVATAALVARIVVHHLRFDDLWLYSSTLTRMDALAMGALVAVAMRSENWRARLSRNLKRLGLATALAFGAVVALTHGVNRNNPLMQVFGYSALACGCALFVAWAASPTAPRLLAHPVLRFFGKYSYGIYVIHPPLKVAVHAWKRGYLDDHIAAHPVVTDLAFELAVGTTSIALALASWVALERPFTRMKDRLAPR